MPEVCVEVEVFCSCGEGLCNQSTGSSGGWGPRITVEPCQKCLDASYERGVDDGKEEM